MQHIHIFHGFSSRTVSWGHENRDGLTATTLFVTRRVQSRRLFGSYQPTYDIYVYICVYRYIVLHASFKKQLVCVDKTTRNSQMMTGWWSPRKMSYIIYKVGIKITYDIITITARGCWFNTLRPRQNGRHFVDDIFEFSLKCVPHGLIHYTISLVRIMAWRRICDKPLSEAMIV